MTGSPVAVRVFPGLPSQARQARRWVRALVSASCALAADDAQLATGELFANAVVHTRSGAPGGLVTVAVTGDGVIHVHDQGADGTQPHAGLAAALEDRGLPVVSGRGLGIVAAVCAGWGSLPAAECRAGGVGDPAAQPGGRCTWCRPAPWAPGQGRDDGTSTAGAATSRPAAGWQTDGSGLQPGGEAGGDIQAGPAWSIRYRLAGRAGAMITRTCYPACYAEQPGTFFVQVETERLVCADPADPGRTEIWADLRYDDLPGIYPAAAEAEAAACRAAVALLGDGASQDWDGLPPWERG